MSSYPTGAIPLTGGIGTTGAGDTFPTNFDYLGYSGYRSVTLLTDLDAIPVQRRNWGMVVTVTGDSTATNNISWILANAANGGTNNDLSNNANWIPYVGSAFLAGITGSGAAGEIAVWSGNKVITGYSGFLWDNVNKVFTVDGSVLVGATSLPANTYADIYSANTYTSFASPYFQSSLYLNNTINGTTSANYVYLGIRQNTTISATNTQNIVSLSNLVNTITTNNGATGNISNIYLINNNYDSYGQEVIPGYLVLFNNGASFYNTHTGNIANLCGIRNGVNGLGTGTITNLILNNHWAYTGTMTVSNIVYNLLGTGTAPAGNWSLYDATGFNNYFGIGNSLFGTTTNNGVDIIQANGSMTAISSNSYTGYFVNTSSNTALWGLSNSGIGVIAQSSFGIPFIAYGNSNTVPLFTINNIGRVIINAIDNNVDILQVGGNINATGYKIPSGTSSQYLMANGSVSTLTNPITGTGTSGQVAVWSGTNTQTGYSNYTWDGTNNILGVNGTAWFGSSSNSDILFPSQSYNYQFQTRYTVGDFSNLDNASNANNNLLLINNTTYNASNYYWGLGNGVYKQGSANVSRIGGITSNVLNQGSGNIDGMFGYVTYMGNVGAGNISNLTQIQINSPVITSTGIITNATGLRIGAQQVTGVTSGLALMQLGSSDFSYFQGKVAFGGSTNDGINAIQVTGTSAFTGNIGINTSNATQALTLGYSSNGIAYYNTSDQTTNYERVRQYWSSNSYNISSENGGTGTNRAITISNSNLAALFTINTSSTIGGSSPAIFNFSRSSSGAFPIVGINGTFTSSTGVATPFAVLTTINQSGTAYYNAIYASIYEQTVGSSVNYLINVGTNSLANNSGVHTAKFVVDDNGNISNSGNANINGNIGGTYNRTLTSLAYDTRTTNLTLNETGVFSYKMNNVWNITNNNTSSTGIYTSALDISNNSTVGDPVYGYNVILRHNPTTGSGTYYYIGFNGSYIPAASSFPVYSVDMFSVTGNSISNGTVSNWYNFHSYGNIFSNTAVGNFYSFYAADQTGATGSVYGYYSNISSGTNKWNLYMVGGASNYLSSTLLLGTGTSNAAGILQTAGNIVPSTDNTYSLGTTSYRWSNVYATSSTISGLTAGSVVFAGTGGLLSQNNAQLFWDNTNNGLYVGTNTPIVTGYTLQVNGSSLFSNNIVVGNGTNTSSLNLVINGAAGYNRSFKYWTNGLTRWNVLTDNSTESGSNVGSNFGIQYFTDAGTLVNNALYIYRNTGNVALKPSSDLGYGFQNAGTTYLGSTTLIGTSINNAAGILQTAGNIVPSVTNTYSLGTSSYVWSNIYATSQTISGLTAGQVVFTGTGGLLSGSSGFTYSGQGVRLSSNIITVSGNGILINNTMNATVNGDQQTGLAVNVSFNDGSYTGVNKYAVQIAGRGYSQLTANVGGFSLPTNGYGLQCGWNYSNGGGETSLWYNKSSGGVGGLLIGENIAGSGTYYAKFYASTGNLTLQNGGTFIDDGINKLQVNGTQKITATTTAVPALTLSGTITSSAGVAQGVVYNGTLTAAANNDVLSAVYINPTFSNGNYTGVSNYALYVNNGIVAQKSTASTESAPLGSELLSTSGWTTTGWTGTDPSVGFTHTTGNTTALTNSITPTVNNLYQVTFTVTGRTAGTFTITLGGVTSSLYSTSVTFGPKATTTGTFSITPTTDFNGTIVISIKQITGTYSPSYVLQNSAGNSALEIRSTTNVLNNQFIGLNAGRYNTTGYYNTANGVSSLYSNTTGAYNTANGGYSLSSNTAGAYNTANGVNALCYNTTGYNNTANGVSSLSSNTTGYNNTANGVNALYSNTTGYYNTASGGYSLSSNTTGYNNTAYGYNAGRYLSDGSTALTAPNNSLFVGYNTMASADGNTNENVIGCNAVGLGSNTTVLGNSSTVFTYLAGKVAIGSTTNDGINALQVNGTQKITATTTAVPALTLSGTITSSAGVAQGVVYNGTLTAAANNDVLSAVYINPTFTDGAFTGVLNWGINSTANIISSGFYVGTLGFTDTNILSAFQGSVNNYDQLVLQNTNAGAVASTDLVVNNNLGTATTYYGNFGMNSSAFTGTGSYSLANAVYLTATTGDLVIGTTTSNAVHFIVNNGAADAMQIFTTGHIGINTPTDTGYTLSVNGQALISQTANYSGGASNFAQYVVNNGTYAASSTWTNGHIYAGQLTINNSLYNGSQSVANGALLGGNAMVNQISFGTAGYTLTMNYSTSNPRAYSGLLVQNQISGSNNGTVTDLAGIEVLGIYKNGSGTITVTNSYGILINAMNEYAGATITNSWGIYQYGANDKNFLQGELILGSGQSVTSSTTNTVTNKVKVTIGGVAYYFLVSTSAT